MFTWCLERADGGGCCCNGEKLDVFWFPSLLSVDLSPTRHPSYTPGKVWPWRSKDRSSCHSPCFLCQSWLSHNPTRFPLPVMAQSQPHTVSFASHGSVTTPHGFLCQSWLSHNPTRFPLPVMAQSQPHTVSVSHTQQSAVHVFNPLLGATWPIVYFL